MSSVQELVERLLDRLSPGHLLLLLLRGGDLSETEIAAHLEIPVESVPSVAELARRKLLRMLL